MVPDTDKHGRNHDQDREDGNEKDSPSPFHTQMMARFPPRPRIALVSRTVRKVLRLRPRHRRMTALSQYGTR
jgi:hypothetical protein